MNSLHYKSIPTLRFSNRAIKRLKSEHGIDLNKGIADVTLAEGVDPLAPIWWAGRLHENPALSLAGAVEEMDGFEPGIITKTVINAIQHAFNPNPEAEPLATGADESPTDKSGKDSE